MVIRAVSKSPIVEGFTRCAPAQVLDNHGDIEWAAGKAMDGLTLVAQVAGVAWMELGAGSR